MRITGLTILPPPGTAMGTLMVLAYLSGPFRASLLGDQNAWYGAEVHSREAAAR